MPSAPSPAVPGPRRRSTSLVAGLVLLVVAVLGLTGTTLSPGSAQLDVSARSGDTARVRHGEVSLFPERRPRRVVKDRDRRPVEIGTQFRSSAAGQVTGVQVYKIAAAKGATPRRASLWSPRGKRLAEARLTPREGAGWVDVRFAAPVRIGKSRTYTVSVHAPKGRPAVTQRGLRKARNSGALTTGGKRLGVYRYGTRSKFPTRTWRKTNYWVDVLFQPATVTPTPTPTPTHMPPGTDNTFPTQATTGVPAGWTPAQVASGTYRVTTPGAVIEDLRVNGSIDVAAPNVTLRRVEVIGGSIDNFGGPTCQGGLVVEDSTIRRDPTGSTSSSDAPALGTGGYTARRVEIDGVAEGFRVGGRASGCGAVVIEDSWARVVRPDVCDDWHGDGIQGYDGPALAVRRTSLILDESGCGGTAPFFYPSSQGNERVVIDGLLVEGGGYSFRLGTPGSVRGLAVVDGSWHYGPVNVKCSVIQDWQASVVTLTPEGVITPVRSLGCNMEEGG